MEFFEAVEYRRSVRSYTPDAVPSAVVEKALDAAVLAPNSSNMQTWRIYWVRDPQKKRRLAEACLDQGAARTAQELVVFVADPSTWEVAQQAILQSLGDVARPDIKKYYEKMMPLMYGFRFLAPIKWLIFNGTGLFKPMVRHPWSSADIEVTAVKSCALACENFMLAIAAQKFDTCPMEGFDEVRVRRLLNLRGRARVVMVISVGRRSERGIWGERFRLPRQTVVKVL